MRAVFSDLRLYKSDIAIPLCSGLFDQYKLLKKLQTVNRYDYFKLKNRFDIEFLTEGAYIDEYEWHNRWFLYINPKVTTSYKKWINWRLKVVRTFFELSNKGEFELDLYQIPFRIGLWDSKRSLDDLKKEYGTKDFYRFNQWVKEDSPFDKIHILPQDDVQYLEAIAHFDYYLYNNKIDFRSIPKTYFYYLPTYLDFMPLDLLFVYMYARRYYTITLFYIMKKYKSEPEEVLGRPLIYLSSFLNHRYSNSRDGTNYIK